jgi:hypothetical protein
LWVSPSLIETVPPTPSSLRLAPQPPPSGPKFAIKNSEVFGLTPCRCDSTRSAWWPAMTRPGIAFDSALNTLSMIVIG